MVSIDNSGHIIRKESGDTQAESEIAAQKRKEIAEILRNGDSIELTPGKMIFESFEESDPQIATLNSRWGPIALIFLEKGVIKFNWAGYQYYISNSFETGTSTDEIFARCNDIISALVFLEELFSKITQLKYDVDDSKKKIIDWNQINDWLSKCPIKFRNKPVLKVT